MPETMVDSNHPLALAIERNSIEDVKRLVEDGADINMIFYSKTLIETNGETREDNFIEKKNTPLTLAVKKNETEIAKYLIESGANVNTRASRKKYIWGACYSKSYNTLILAFKQNSIELVKCLIEHGADYKEDFSGQYSLTLAIENGMTDSAKYLVEHDADVNMETREYFNYKTPLKAAIKNGSIEMVQYLIDHGADVNMKICDYHGGYDYKDFKTPLSIAINHGSLEIVKLLVENGADVNMGIIDTDEDYCAEKISPLDIANENGANENGANEIANYLVEKGAIAGREFVDDDNDDDSDDSDDNDDEEEEEEEGTEEEDYTHYLINMGKQNNGCYKYL